MKVAFKLPKSVAKTMRSANYDFLVPVTLNETNLERMLIQILERMVKNGKTSPPHTGEKDTAQRYQELLDNLQKHPQIRGFDDDYGRAILDGWLRTSVVEMIPVSKSKSGEQIDYLRLLSVASYRSGLPKWRSRNRKTDAVIYRSMLKAVQLNQGGNSDSLRLMLEKTELTAGINFPQISYPWKDPVYSNGTPVDISSLLEMRFVEGIQAKEPKPDSEQNLDLALPQLFDPLGKDMLNLLMEFSNLSAGELNANLTSVMALRLFQVPIRTSVAIGRHLDSGEPDEGPTCEMFFDFTGERESPSDLLSRRSVQHDLQSVSALFPRLVLLRETESLLWGLSKLNEEFKALNYESRFSMLIELTMNPSIHAHAGFKLGQIESQIAEESGESTTLGEFSDFRQAAENDLVALQNILVADHGTTALAGYRKWLYSTGGLTSSGLRRDYAILEGSMSKTSTWKYSMSESVLNAVINLCFLDDKGKLPVRKQLEMDVLLNRLKERFGVLIAEPPSYANDSVSQLAALQNYEAFTRTLKLLGYFQGLSDDFNAQHITRIGADR
jgi:hypothetical protein